MTNEMENKVVVEEVVEVTTEETKKEKFVTKAWNGIKTHKKAVIGAGVALAVTGVAVVLYKIGAKEAADSCTEVVKEALPDNVIAISDVIEAAEEVAM